MLSIFKENVRNPIRKSVIRNSFFLRIMKNALAAKNIVSYHIARAGETHNIAENVRTPCAKYLVACI